MKIYFEEKIAITLSNKESLKLMIKERQKEEEKKNRDGANHKPQNFEIPKKVRKYSNQKSKTTI